MRGTNGEYVLFKLSSQRGFSIKVEQGVEQRVEWGGQGSPEHLWRKSNPATTTACAKVLRWDYARQDQITACGKVEPHE